MPLAEAPPENRVFLQPGELWMDDVPAVVKTVLGSCVTITMRAPRLGLASMSHCLLPTAGSEGKALSRAEALRYVDTTIEILLDAFRTRGAAFSELEVKLIGGADNLLQGGPRSRYSVGRRNVQQALRILAEKGINPVVTIVGGRTGRVMLFDAGTGAIFVKRLLPQQSQEEE